MLEQSRQPKAKENILEEVVGQELFLYDYGNDAAYCTNGGAALIWFLCDGTRSVVDIANEISMTFHLPMPKVLEEVIEGIEQFISLNLLDVDGKKCEHPASEVNVS